MVLPIISGWFSLSDEVLAQSSNDSRHHLDAQPGPPFSPVTVQQTVTTTRDPGHSSTTDFAKATSRDPSFPGCSMDCTLSETLLTYHRNSWTRCPGVTVVGRVHYIIDSANNKTSTSTSYLKQVTYESDGVEMTTDVSDILANNSPIIARTDVNAAGTVTYLDGTHTM